MAKSFKKWLEERKFSESLDSQTAFKDAIDALTEIVEGIQADAPHEDIQVSLLAGFPTNSGQQYIVSLKDKEGRIPIIKLFRVYVALDGSEVSFDFYDEKPTVVAAARDEMFDAVSKFLIRPATIGQFQQLKDMLDRYAKQKN